MADTMAATTAIRMKATGGTTTGIDGSARAAWAHVSALFSLYSLSVYLLDNGISI